MKNQKICTTNGYGIVTAVYDSADQAAKKTGLSKEKIIEASEGHTSSYNGKRWDYCEEAD